MGQSYIKPLTFRLITAIVLIIAVLVIHSCKKDKVESDKNLSVVDPIISRAKQWYDSTYAATNNKSKQSTQSVGAKLHDWSKKFLPYWSNARIFTQNGIAFIELQAIKKGDMALAFTKPKDTLNFDFGRSGTVTHLLIVKQQNNFSMYAMTILADTSYLKGDYSKLGNNSYQKMDSTFTGAVLFNKMDGTFVNGWRYKNGVVTSQLSSSTSGNINIQSSKLKVDVTQPIPPGCGAIVVVTLWQDCTYYGNDPTPYNCFTFTTTDVYADCSTTTTFAPSSGGTAPAPTPCIPNPTPPTTPSGAPAQSSVRGRLIINVTTGGSGSGGTTTPPPPLQPCVAVVKPVTTTTQKDPCTEKNAISTKESNPTIASQNAQLLNMSTTSTNEYGTSQNLSTLDGNTYDNTPITTSGLTDQFSPAFSWDSTNGYTIGFSHDHPDNNTPSPFDVISMIGNANNPELVAAGPAAMQFYQTNVSSTIVTSSGNYVITVNNWSSLQAIYSQQFLTQGAAAFKANFLQLSTSYQSNEPGASLIEAGEYALLKMFGNSINLYAADPDSTKYVPLIIDSSGKVAKKQC